MSMRDPQLVKAYAHCRMVAKQQAKNFYYGFLALPSHKRDAMCAIYAFMRRADDLADDEAIPIGKRRELMAEWMQSWRGETQVSSEDAPVFRAVRDVQAVFGVSGDLLEKLVQGTTMDLAPELSQGVRRVHLDDGSFDQYETEEALERYCYLVASVVGLVTIRIFGYSSADAETYAEQLGLAFQLTNILRDVKEDADRGRVYLPEDWLNRHALSTKDVLEQSRRGFESYAMRALLAEMAARAQSLYRASDRLIPLLEQDSRSAMRVLVRIYYLLLLRIIRMRYRVFERRVSVPTARKLLVLMEGLVRRLIARVLATPGAKA